MKDPNPASAGFLIGLLQKVEATSLRIKYALIFYLQPQKTV